MIKNWSSFGVVTVSIIALTAALILQSWQAMEPCTYCIIQRYLLVILLFWAWVPNLFIRAIGGTLVAILGFYGSLTIHMAVQNQDMGCGRDLVAEWINWMPWVNIWPDFWMATGSCGEYIPAFLGLPLYIWSALTFFVISIIFWLSYYLSLSKLQVRNS